MYVAGKNSKPKNRVYRQPKTGFSVLKVTRFFGFGKNRVGNPTDDTMDPNIRSLIRYVL